ncbi:molecular chaperone (small heat shock protein) [Sphaerochaeta pleomorpha str. Grapes]|uniref:Molecular chaperone (Small heat shock protein) n=1 Tax=Sphaerochaeta pleomorpha (strain ATCC BAA-1885 / DSM 22778 / Grapes) TaxID=158190 RepID=G8QRG7_SPHPG|nr:Hsp20/alpha crystallin family protein [Sphaerochaeta pleomorpha]AEV29889.1 molecular chaperone (small heat shock protein) [Sphaerochaeta pleomorpha str. Grapes]
MKYLVKKDPNYPIVSSFNSLFNDFFGDWGISNSRIPPVDITENDDSYILEAELPGYKQEDVKVNVEKHVLRLSSTKETCTEEKEGKKTLVRERCFQSFERSFSLPEDVNENLVEGEFVDGVLRVTMPKQEVAKPKKIEVKIKNTQ